MDVNYLTGGTAVASAVNTGKYQPYSYKAGTVSDAGQNDDPVQNADSSNDPNFKTVADLQKEKELDKRMEDAIERANEKVKHFGMRQCEFAYNKEAKRITIKVFDAQTKEVIREIPPEKTIEMIERLYDMEGILVDEKR